MWFFGKWGMIYCYEAKVYQKPSRFGINNGCVSKLYVQRRNPTHKDYIPIAHYERGWIMKPKTKRAKNIVDEIVKHLESAA